MKQWGEVSRREALRRLLATTIPVTLWLYASAIGDVGAVQLSRPRNLRIVADIAPSPESPLARGLHPRTLLTPSRLASLRTQLASDAAFKARWQEAVRAFEAPGGYWAANSTNPLTNAFAALLTCVRRPDNDLGLSWSSSWQVYRDRIVTAVQSWNHTGESGMHALAHGVVYDLLYPDLNQSERAQLHGWIVSLLDTKTKLKWQSQGGHWDDQTSDEHTARVILSVAAEDGLSRVARAYQESSDYADAHEAMQYGEGL